jgi:hypothetical protein
LFEILADGKIKLPFVYFFVGTNEQTHGKTAGFVLPFFIFVEKPAFLSI